MREIQLTPENLKILEAIIESKKIEVPKLVERLKIDRGKLEGAIATLAEEKLIARKTISTLNHILTERGLEASNGLVEHKIIDLLTQAPMTMKDLNSTGLLEKYEMAVAHIPRTEKQKRVRPEEWRVSTAVKELRSAKRRRPDS